MLNDLFFNIENVLQRLESLQKKPIIHLHLLNSSRLVEKIEEVRELSFYE